MQILPYIPPQRTITARAAPQCLEEHLLAFLAANNRSGFDLESSAVPDSEFMQQLGKLHELDRLSEDAFKRAAWKLKKLTTGSVKHGHVLEVCARAFGYASYNDLRATRRWSHQDQQWFFVNRMKANQ
jgi:hypothetical protein